MRRARLFAVCLAVGLCSGGCLSLAAMAVQEVASSQEAAKYSRPDTSPQQTRADYEDCRDIGNLYRCMQSRGYRYTGPMPTDAAR